MIIYKATNTITNKSYIGLTTRSLQERKCEHIRRKKDENTYFHQSIVKYGSEVFIWEVIDDTAASLGELQELEKYYIKYYNTLAPNGYNLNPGGAGGDCLTRRDYSYGNNPSARPVIGITSMKVYDSIIRASQENHLSTQSIYLAIKNKKPSYGHYWDYYEPDKQYSPKIQLSKSSRKRIKNTETNEIFNTISDAALANHCARKTIRNWCNDESNEKWQYI